VALSVAAVHNSWASVAVVEPVIMPFAPGTGGTKSVTLAVSNNCVGLFTESIPYMPGILSV